MAKLSKRTVPAKNLGGNILDKLVLIDGNSIMNRAFYGIMGSKMLTTKDGTYTNAVYGFLAILFKLLEDVNPNYLVVAFDLKAPTARHKAFEGYKANRHGMPDELREQMPIIKDILRAMNIDIVEMEGYEADDVLGTLSRYGEKEGLEVTILSGDRDTFQLATDKVTIRIPRTKAGKTETEEYNREKIVETYGVEPKQLIEVKGLQGDTSDNIPGVPGIGEKTALSLIQKYGTIENLYKQIEDNTDDLKGKQREKIAENKELAELSRFLGTINLEVPIKDTLENFKVEEWDKQKVFEIFKELNFNRYIERFGLNGEPKKNIDVKEILKIENKSSDEIIKFIKEKNQMIFDLITEKDEKDEKIIKEKIVLLAVYNKEKEEAYYLEIKNENLDEIKEIFEDENIIKIGTHLAKIYILLKQVGITIKGIKYDAKIAAYILNPTNNKLDIQSLAMQYLELDINEYLQSVGADLDNKQINLFDSISENVENKNKYVGSINVYAISKLYDITIKQLEEINAISLFNNIDMPTVEVLSNMQWNGMYADIKELDEFGNELKQRIEVLTKIIYEMAGEEFNINSTKQLGEVLFEKMKLPVIKKTKSGYSTDVDVLEKLKKEDPIIEQILEYRQLMKLHSTYVEGLKPYINKSTKRIHSFFHQTITATRKNKFNRTKFTKYSYKI